jgi:hypothetical protein
MLAAEPWRRAQPLSGTFVTLAMSQSDMARAALTEGDEVSLIGDAGDNVHREVAGLTVTPFNLRGRLLSRDERACAALVS